MAQRTEVRLIDDIDGEEADENVEFAIDGKAYEIDLSEKNAKVLREGLTPFINSGRRISRSGGRRVASAPRPPTDRAQNQAIREWAQKQGLKINERGRIPADVLEQYHQVH